jgi:hypothetical protein
MRIVHHHDRAVFLGGLHQAGQRPDVAIHREHAIGDQQLSPRLPVQLGQFPFGRRRIFVRKDVDLRAREPAAVDDAGVIQFVGDDVIFGSQHRRHGARVGREPGLKHHARFYVLETGDALLKLHVQRHGSRNRAHRSRPHAVAPGGVQRRFPQLRVCGQPQIVVGGEVDHVLAIEARFGGALRFQNAQPLIRSGPLPAFQLLRQIS